MNIQGILKGIVPILIALILYDMFVKKMVIKSYDFEEDLEMEDDA